MPYFDVRITQTQAESFLIEAADQSAAEDAAALFDPKKTGNKKVVLTHKDSSRAIDVSSASKADMTAALKKKRAN